MDTPTPFDAIARSVALEEALTERKRHWQGCLGANDTQYERLIEADLREADFQIVAQHAHLGIDAQDLLLAIQLLHYGIGPGRFGKRALDVGEYVALRQAGLRLPEIGFCLVFRATADAYREAMDQYQDILARPGVLPYLSQSMGCAANAPFFQVLAHPQGWRHGGAAVQGFLRHAFSRLGIPNPDPIEPSVSLQRGVEPLFDDFQGSLTACLARERLFCVVIHASTQPTQPDNISSLEGDKDVDDPSGQKG